MSNSRIARMLAMKAITLALLVVVLFAFPGFDWRHILLLVAQVAIAWI